MMETNLRCYSWRGKPSWELFCTDDTEESRAKPCNSLNIWLLPSVYRASPAGPVTSV
jgi:hypothetical protein